MSLKLGDDGYYLSDSNPVANVDQRDLERLTLRLLDRPDVQAARERAREMWLRVCDQTTPAEQRARIEGDIASYCVKATMIAAASDATVPRVLRVYAQGAEWLGHRMPSAKWGGDNPNNAYRVIAVASDGRYELQGRRADKQPSAYVTYQLVGDTCTSVTMSSLEQRDIDIDADGHYRLTLDGTPADGRRNHLCIPPGTLFLFVRDSCGSWQETPDELRIRRLDTPARAPLSEDELAQRAVRNIVSDLFYAYYASRLFHNRPQVLPQPVGSGAVGGLVTQQASNGVFSFRDDEAVVITRTHAGAAYRDIVLHDALICSLDNRDHLTSYTNAQMALDADGRSTFVIALRDPGVHNWLDPTGLHDVTVLVRWQGLPDAPPDAPSIESRIVPVAELEAAMPAGVARVTPAQRAEQLARRRAEYDRRSDWTPR